MKKKFHLFNFGEDKARGLAEIMSNKTSKKILDYLNKKDSSETDISNELNIPLSTVHYNLQKLSENGLIEIKDFYWSDKGNKINVYKATNKTFIFTPSKSKFLENKLAMVLSLAVIVSLLFIINISYFSPDDIVQDIQLSRFSSGEELVNALKEASKQGRGGIFLERTFASGSIAMLGAEESFSDSVDYSETNIQVQGVDEADIVKTDGEYIYTITNNKLIIAKAYPAEDAEILSNIELGNFNPRELFIHDDRLLVLGSASYNFENSEEISYPRYLGVMSIRLYDISDKEDVELLKTVDFEGSYLTSRKINEDVYFVINSYPRYYGDDVDCEDIIPLYREDNKDLKAIAECTEIGYVEPIQAQNFITIASISMDDMDVEKETIVGSSENVYASLNNLYIAQTSWNRDIIGELTKNTENTIITKFKLDNGEIKFSGTGEVKGHILNQFSMDEYDNNFRIATTSGSMWGGDSKNNVYVLDEDLELIGELEDLAPGEKIYSVRFMGKKGYVVTFKKIDPLFVIDLSKPRNPSVLGKLKIPGYSDYLHPYDENHIIGIGKDTVEAEESDIGRRNLDFAWYQGIKMAIFDVSDVENPIEMHKVVIGDRGTDSDALHDHKAFLFDKEKNLLVIPITLAEIKGEKTRDNQYGDFVFQGAYVYDLSLDKGFDLKGKVSHYEDEEVFKKSGYYFRGDSAIKRSLYIDDVLYTVSFKKIKLNSLKDLEEIKELVF